jgi:hypothetical protein
MEMAGLRLEIARPHGHALVQGSIRLVVVARLGNQPVRPETRPHH